MYGIVNKIYNNHIMTILRKTKIHIRPVKPQPYEKTQLEINASGIL